MDSLETFGFVTVCLSLVCYGLEEKSPHYTLGFGVTCIAGAVYAFMKEAWPFAFIEIFWTVLAVRKWWKLRGNEAFAILETPAEVVPVRARDRSSKAG